MKQLFYGSEPADQEYPIEPYDEVNVVFLERELRVPALVKSIMPNAGLVVVSFEGIDPVLDMIALRKTAKVPAASLELVTRGF